MPRRILAADTPILANHNAQQQLNGAVLGHDPFFNHSLELLDRQRHHRRARQYPHQGRRARNHRRRHIRPRHVHEYTTDLPYNPPSFTFTPCAFSVFTCTSLA